MGVTATVQCIMQLGFTVVVWLRSEIWLVLPTFRQRNNSLNSWKLPGRFSYGLGTKLDKSRTVGQTMRWVTQLDILNCIPKCDRSCTYTYIVHTNHSSVSGLLLSRLPSMNAIAEACCWDVPSRLHCSHTFVFQIATMNVLPNFGLIIHRNLGLLWATHILVMFSRRPSNNLGTTINLTR